MSSLFHFTLYSIKRRQVEKIPDLDKSIFSFDGLITSSVRSFLRNENTEDKVLGFIDSLKGFFRYFEKELNLQYFKKFIKNEELLEKIIPAHIQHFEHVIQVFLLGYNILTHWTLILDNKIFSLQNEPLFTPFDLLYAWVMASLFHDYGYIIEKIKEHYENLTSELNDFQDFTIPEVKLQSTKIDLTNPNTKENFNYLHQIFTQLSNVTPLSVEDFEKLFTIKKDNGYDELDHGIVSALSFIKFLDEAKEEYELKVKREIPFFGRHSRLTSRPGLSFREWNANKYAILSMALHNFSKIKY